MEKYQNPTEIEALLTNKGATWAVVGLSKNRERPAYHVTRTIKDELGMNIIPINPRGESAYGIEGYKTIKDIKEPIDVVDCFVNSENVGEIVDQAIEIKAKAVWLQLGVINEVAAKRAQKAGLIVVVDTCPVIQGRKLGLFS
ncbi:MAG: CoA-binding protein [Micrococcaceae bacterium]